MSTKILAWLIVVGGTLLCLLFSPPAAIIFLLCSLALLLLWYLQMHHYRGELTTLCDAIHRILNGAEDFHLDAYEEGELSILATELYKLTLELRTQNAALAQKQSFMQESLEDISHQLRTPLTSMMLLTEMMRSPNLTKQQQTENFHELTALLSRMKWLIETLLNLSRLDANAVHFRHETIHCDTLLHQAIEPLSIALELKCIDLQRDVAPDTCFTGDFQYYCEALTNLLKNCMEHTPAGGAISISAQKNALYTQIIITDSGKGIAEQDLPHLFERFYRGSDFSKSGYGIGLAFAKRIITAQNGCILARNAKPHGAVFEIRIYPSTV